MHYYSTNRQSPGVAFREACIRGQAPDRGLYFPGYIPAADPETTGLTGNLSPEEIAFRVMHPYTKTCLPEEVLFRIVSDTIAFPIPLVPVTDSLFSLELFHGPTLAFKDVGARFMSRCLGYFVSTGMIRKKKITILVATSGDTGGAVANGFHGVEGVEVVILYPSGKVSPVQEKQLTTLGGNVHALEVEGSFDDCQQMVKEAFADKALEEHRFLTSANSINVARWLPQQIYYFLAWRQWQDKTHPPVISVPSGNFGNICAGLLAMRSGLPVRHFIAACNANDVVSEFLENGGWHPHPAIPTLTNAMDVGNPSNFVRIRELFQQDREAMRKQLSGFRISDAETEAAIGELYRTHHYLADPHGALGFLALQRYLGTHPSEKGIFLETAHPVKFPGAVGRITGKAIPIPDYLAPLLQREKLSTFIPAGYASLRDWLLSV